MRIAIRTAALIIPACLISPCLPAAPAHSRAWHVNASGTGDAPTIQAAVDSAGPGDEIVVAPGIYTWTQQGHTGEYGMIFFDRGVGGFTLRGESGPGATILDAEHQGRVMFVMAYNDLVIEGFTFRNGRAPLDYDSGGALIGHLSGPAIRNCVFTGNTAQNGGGLWYGGVSAPLIEDCAFIDNHAVNGGGICLVNSSTAARIARCLVAGNTAADRGGGIFVYHYAAEIEDCTIAENEAGAAGGGLCAQLAYPSGIDRCTIAENEAPAGGGIFCMYGSDLSVLRSVIARTGRGGALGMEDGGALEVGCCLLYENSGGDSLPAGALDAGYNHVLDPQFCGIRGSRNWTVQEDSPCLPFNHPEGLSCQRIGAWPAGCGPVGAGRATWGSTKKRHR
ncbi:MAG: right-handed parallel beta-helix repeat-containing protein [Candidatus Krumholzibacteria bacterium]|nr:right-handed parallel beta-helix repeat-containing protein [Candidatus Krumholzibacteria bacterium]